MTARLTRSTLLLSLCPYTTLFRSVQRDGFGVGEEGVGVHFAHGAGDAVWPTGGTDKPAVLSQSVVNVLHCTDGACLVKL